LIFERFALSHENEIFPIQETVAIEGLTLTVREFQLEQVFALIRLGADRYRTEAEFFAVLQDAQVRDALYGFAVGTPPAFTRASSHVELLRAILRVNRDFFTQVWELLKEAAPTIKNLVGRTS
jgi:hypothetical protein